MTRKMIWLGVFIGGAIGGYIPTLWGADAVSMSSIFFGGLGSILGIWAGYKIATM